MFLFSSGITASCRTARYILGLGGGSADPYWNNVTFLASFDTDYTDSKTGMTPSTNTSSIDNVESKFGGGSLNPIVTRYSDATAFNHGTDDFTTEFWVNLTSATYGNYIIDNRSTTDTSSFYIHVHTDTGQLWAGSGEGTYGAFNHKGLGVWQHIAIVGQGGTVKFYLDGALQVQGGGSFNGTSGVINLGHERTDGAQLDGYIDEVRVTGAARYTENFTPATEAFPTTQELYGSNIATTATATADEINGGFVAANTNDGSYTTRWSTLNSGYPHWLRLQYGAAKTIAKFSIVKYWDGSNLTTLKNFTFEGSNNGSDWTTLGTYQAEDNSTDQEVQNFVVDQSKRGSYTYYRIEATDNWVGNGYIGLREIEMFEIA